MVINMKNFLLNLSLGEVFPYLSLVGLVLLLGSSNSLAGSVNLAWEASTSSDIGGYRIYYGQNSNNYPSTIDAGQTTSYTVTGLQDGSDYFFAVKTYDSTKTTESVYSNEVSITVPVPVPLTTDFTASKTSGPAPVVVDFTPVTTGTVTSYNWVFPGSYTPTVSISTPGVVRATYPNAGTYSVGLTATGTSGSSVTKTKSNLITVTSAPPITSELPATTTSTETSPTPSSNASTSGLVAAYGFEENSGAAIVDASGQGNHGTIKEAVRITSGRYGKALKFDGVNDWITVNHSDSLDLSTGMTLEAWVYPQDLTIGNTVIVKETFGGAVYNLYASEDVIQPVSSFNDGQYRIITGPDPLPENQWTHLVATYDGLIQRLYVNGVEVAKQSRKSLINASSGELRIGGNSIWGEFFKGLIDEVRIYNRALTNTEVQNNLSTAISVSNPPQLVIGNEALEPRIDSRQRSVAEAHSTAPEQSGIVINVERYLDSRSTATELVAGIDSNNNGRLYQCIAQGNLSALQPGDWNSIPIPATSVTTVDRSHWIATSGAKGEIVFLEPVETGTGAMETNAATGLTSLPSTWSSSADKPNSSMSVYGSGYSL